MKEKKNEGSWKPRDKTEKLKGVSLHEGPC